MASAPFTGAAALTAAVLAAGVLTGCTTPDPLSPLSAATPVPPAVPTSAPGVGTAPDVTATQGPDPQYSASVSWDPMPGLEQGEVAFPGGVVDEDTGETIESQPVPTWDATSRTEVATAATTVMAAFARPDLDQATWWVGVEPLLSPQAAQVYAYVDPATVPARQVTGPATLAQDVADTSAYLATVQVPTDVGRYLVVLSRSDAAAPWLVERLTPPDEVG